MNTKTLLTTTVAFLLLAPAAQAQIDNPTESTQTTLYFHVFDTFNNFVINTQAMNVSFFEVGGTNFPSIPPTPVLAENGWDFNTIYGTSTAGPVEYDFIENGRPRFHPERGIAEDVLIDESVQPMAYFYFHVPDVTGADTIPGVLPYLTVDITMREGDEFGGDDVLDAGELIMEGSTTVHAYSGNGDIFGPAVGVFEPTNAVVGGLPLDHPVVIPDENGIIEVAIPMEIAQGIIPKSDAFNIRVDWYQFADAPVPLAEEDQIALGNFKIIADATHLPRLEMAITNPVYIEFIHPQVAAGTLLIHTGANSPWGTYDLDVSNVQLTVDGPSTPVNLDEVVAQNQHVHGLHDKAAEITYLWKFRDEQAAQGDYKIRMAITNAAGTATAVGQAGFTIEGSKAFGVSDTGDIVEPSVDEGSNGSPGAGVVVILAVMALAVALRRRA